MGGTMTEEHIDQMRTYMVLAEAVAPVVIMETEEATEGEPVEESNANAAILHDLSEMAFKLRGFMESSEGDYALGVEAGMQRAAEMIDNLIRRYTEGE